MYELRMFIHCLLLFFDVIIQTTKFKFNSIQNFTTKCIGGQIKDFSFLFFFVPLVMGKVRIVESVNIQSAIAKPWVKKEQAWTSCVFIRSGKVRKGGERYRGGYETTSKNVQIKRKQNCSVYFVKVIKFQENKFKIVQKNF